MGKYCDLGHIINPAAPNKEDIEVHPEVEDKKAVFALEVDSLHLGKSFLLKPGSYKLRLLMTSANSSPIKKDVEITIAGDWFDDREKMFCDGVSIR